MARTLRRGPHNQIYDHLDTLSGEDERRYQHFYFRYTRDSKRDECDKRRARRSHKTPGFSPHPKRRLHHIHEQKALNDGRSWYIYPGKRRLIQHGESLSIGWSDDRNTPRYNGGVRRRADKCAIKAGIEDYRLQREEDMCTTCK